MRTLLKNKFCILLLFQLFIGKAQEAEKLKAEYNSGNSIEKINLYENLNLNEKRAYRDFFYQNFPKLAKDEQITSNKKTLIRYKFALAEVYNIKEEELKSIEILKEIQNDKDYKLSQTEQMNVLVGLQKSYLNLNLYSNVFKINSEIAILRKKGASFPLWSYNIKSNLYAQLYLFDKAIPQLKSEIKELVKNPEHDSLIIPSAYNDLGFYYSVNDNIDSAYHYYNLAMRIADRSLKRHDNETYQRLMGLVKGNLAVLKIKEKDYRSAIPLLEADAATELKTNNNKNGAIRSLILLYECYSKLNNLPAAQKSIEQIEQLMNNDISPKVKVSYYKTKAELLKSLHHEDKAYLFYEKAFKLSDSINNKEQRTLLAGNDILYQLEEKDNVIEKQQVDLEKKQKGILSIVAVALGIILITTLFYLYNSRKKRKEIELKNDEISNKNKTIRESLAEKEMLLKEIHHRVKNNLQIISGILELQNLTVSDENAKIILKEGQARIQSIALIHKTLYQSENFSSVPLESYLKELIHAIQTTYRNSATKIETNVKAENIELNINTAIPLSLIINEIITNCFKHAFTGKENGVISITISKENNQYKLVVQDNGIGLPEDFNPKKLKSIGFDLIQGLTKQLEGNFNFENENGTKISIFFKEIKN
ncbi:sensor histidine kinase [Flavobacterium sp. SM15]|uniref:tetratricopeptide repeat-containing sensor histidine kinase n=1 Tax=Flavobacterium sp. SM15 TaxID=2908005 RepID=UPI001EDAB982|nr:sensor histidine kinase [Flavobacterium sp. SM15]MCG2612402.1 sensor histidine kinase [Flavobacterium sp. SM15]